MVKTRIRVESSLGSGKYLDVRAQPANCPCLTFQARAGCEHVLLARDVVVRACKSSKYLFKSALHKDLRRGDFLGAMHWAYWVDRGYGPGNALEYLRKIWSEETVNLDLAVRLHQEGISLVEAVDLFCRSAKIWEFPELWTVLQACWRVPQTNGRLASPNVLARQVQRGDYRALARQLVRFEPDTVGRARWRESVMDALISDGRLSHRQRRVFDIRYDAERYEEEDTVLLLLAGGKVPSGACRYAPEVDRKSPGLRFHLNGSHVRQVPLYAYDYHTIAGRDRISAWQSAHPDSEIRIGVDTDPVDLRWSGGLMTLFWRFEAFRQAGSTAGMDQLRWCDVLPTKRWDKFAAWNPDWP